MMIEWGGCATILALTALGVFMAYCTLVQVVQMVGG